METLLFYFPLGWEHILSVDALDHQAFLAAMGACYLFPDWKRLLMVVTAFTVGHSLTLALSVIDLFTVNSKVVELLIPITIALTAAQQWWGRSAHQNKSLMLYASALFFGFIHGMGFANNIRFMLSQDQSLGWGLLGFNLGLEAGQLVFMALFLLLAQALVQFFRLEKRKWTESVALITFGISVFMIVERLEFL
ncbi:MAG: HupE/UreJ family protein [Sphingomonadales bacterium]|nr:HupE/UreJ family protein [Sphingomonadales bacterium]